MKLIGFLYREKAWMWTSQLLDRDYPGTMRTGANQQFA